MSYKPILFNTEMVKAIQMGRKTQTRRIVKNQDGIHPRRSNIGFLGWDDGHGYQMMPPCKERDILWVRETWCNAHPNDPFDQFYFKADMPMHWDAEETAHGEAVDITEDDFKWHPSIHMPKAAARIFLRVKDVRVERLQDITEEQAEQEGCAGWHIEISGGPWGVEDDPDEGTAVDDFKRVWDTTIKPADRDMYGWDANPWVWVIEFERCEKPVDWR